MIVGIDLGTTNSLVGVFTERGSQLIPNALGGLLTPSAVSIADDGNIITGQAARDRLISHPEKSAAIFKRWMGTPKEVTLGARSFRPEELSALILRSLIADAEAHLGEKVSEAVISVPAYFGDAQRKATRAAGELAGVRVERLINEPTAAALAYGLEQRMNGSTFIVLDLGGGTFDVSILEIFDGVMQVHASAGDNHLGGEDFLNVLAQTCCRDIDVDIERLPRSEKAQLLSRLEALKVRLSQAGSANAELRFGDRTVKWSIDEDRFSGLVDPLVQRLRAPIERALRDAKLAPSELAEIILVGGASRMPMLSRLVARMLGRLPLRHVNPDQAIALGACIAAGMKARHSALEEVVMTDVCPYTLGVETNKEQADGSAVAGFFTPIIERNCSVPVSRAENFQPMRSGQTKIIINVYQGESPRVDNNVYLGQLLVSVPTHLPPDKNQVEVRFTYDVNGLLQVEATSMATQARYELILQQDGGVLSEADIRLRLAKLQALKVHPRDEQENIALVARADRLYAENLGTTREHIQQLLVQFMAEMNHQDRQAIAQHRHRFKSALDEVEASLKV